MLRSRYCLLPPFWVCSASGAEPSVARRNAPSVYSHLRRATSLGPQPHHQSGYRVRCAGRCSNEVLTNRQEADILLANPGNQFWGRTTNTATAERVSKMFGKIDKTYYATTQGKSKSSPLNIFNPSTRTTSTSTSASIQQRDKLEAQEVMRFRVGEFAGLTVEGGRPEFRATFQAEPTKAIKIAPFQEVGADQVRQNFAAIKAQVRAIVGGEQAPVEQPQDFAIAKPSTPEQAPITPATEEQDERLNW